MLVNTHYNKAQILNVGLRLATLLARFVLVFFLATFLRPAEVGLYGLITVTVGYALYFVGFDFYTYSTRDLLGRPRERWAPLLATQGLFFLVLYAIALPASLLVFAFGLLPWWSVGWVLGLIVAEHLSQEFNRLIVAIGRPLFASVLIFVRQGIWPFVLLGLMWHSPNFRNLPTLLWLWLAGSFLCVLGSGAVLRNMNWAAWYRQLDLDWIKKGVMVAFPLLLATLALRGIFTADRYVFGYMNGENLLGAYVLYMGVASIILTFMDASVFVFHYPAMIERYKNNDYGGFTQAFKKLQRQTLTLVPLLVLGAVICGPPVFSLLPNPIYSQYLALYFVVLVAIALVTISMVPHYVLYATSHDKAIVVTHIIGLAIFLLAIPLFGLVSYLLAIPLAMILAAGFMLVNKTLCSRRVLAAWQPIAVLAG